MTSVGYCEDRIGSFQDHTMERKGMSKKSCSRTIISKRIFILLLLLQICMIEAAPQGALNPPYEKCLGRKCDLRTQYCDQHIGCASCENDCHPARTADNKQDKEDCERKCGWYYVFKEMKEASLREASTERPPTPATPANIIIVENKGMMTWGWTQWFIAAILVVLILLGVSNILALCIACRRDRLRKGYHCVDNNPHRRSIDNASLLKPYDTSVRNLSYSNTKELSGLSGHRSSGQRSSGAIYTASPQNDCSQTTLISQRHRQQEQEQERYSDCSRLQTDLSLGRN